MLIFLRPAIILSGERLQFPCRDRSSVLGGTVFPAQFVSVRILTGPQMDICFLNLRCCSFINHHTDFAVVLASQRTWFKSRYPSSVKCLYPSAAKDATLLNYRPLHVLCLLANYLNRHSSSVQISHDWINVFAWFQQNVLILCLCVAISAAWHSWWSLLPPHFPSLSCPLFNSVNLARLMNSLAC